MREFALTVPAESAGERLDKWLSTALPELTRTAAQRLLDEGRCTVDGKPAGKNVKLRGGEEVFVVIPPPVEAEAQPEDIPLDIVYEDADLLVVNKPKGMVVHPAPGHTEGTLVGALLHHCGDSLSGIGGVLRPGIVHRIDKDTSGLLIVAKSDKAHLGLASQIKEHSFLREYEAVVHGAVREEDFTVDAPIGRDPRDRKRMCVTERNAKRAVTHCHVLTHYRGFTHVRLRLETGRTHQIRVHMAYKGYPVAGDPVYGPRKAAPGLVGQCLHARRIGFLHPITGEALDFTSELPPYFTGFLAKLSPEE